MPIPWSVVRTSEVRDGLGRAVNWSTLKRARIYMCGHGGHLFRDGYCSVPSDTTLNFYQTYGRAMINQHAMAFIRDKSASLALERSFIPGQSCPDMTLFEDDDSELEPTTAALQQRVQMIRTATFSTPTNSPASASTRRPRRIRSTEKRPCA